MLTSVQPPADLLMHACCLPEAMASDQNGDHRNLTVLVPGVENRTSTWLTLSRVTTAGGPASPLAPMTSQICHDVLRQTGLSPGTRPDRNPRAHAPRAVTEFPACVCVAA